MSDTFWKLLASAIFIAIMTGISYALKWWLASNDPAFTNGVFVGGVAIGGFLFLVDWADKKGWLR